MWAFCRYDLGLSDEEFYKYSIMQINELIERKQADIKEREYFSALICSVIANVNRGKGKSYKPTDFMRREEKKKQTTKDMLQVLKNFVK